MSDVAVNLKAFLQTSDAVKAIVAARVHEDKPPQSKEAFPPPFIWFAIRQEVPSPTLSGATGELPDSIVFDLESVASIERVSKDLARTVRAMLHNYRGAFGDTTVKGIFIRDKDSDYIPVNGDRGQFVSAFDVEVWP